MAMISRLSAATITRNHSIHFGLFAVALGMQERRYLAVTAFNAAGTCHPRFDTTVYLLATYS
jgi:hypothetical protein